MDLDRALLAAERAVLLAAEVCRWVSARGPTFVIHEKADTSPVTLADFASQAVITAVLSSELGSDLGGCELSAEEDAEWLVARDGSHEIELVTEAARVALPGIGASDVVELLSKCESRTTTRSRWLVDPLDGTKGFLRGGQYAVSIALIEGNQPVLGVLGCPALGLGEADIDRADTEGSLYLAMRGRGVVARTCSTRDGAMAQALPRIGALSSADPVIAASFEASHGNDRFVTRVAEAVRARRPLLRVDSAVKYALVARGDADAYLRIPAGPESVDYAWDHAAGALIASEAGASVTDLGGRPLGFGRGRCLDEPGVVAARPELHARLVTLLAELGAD
jgi:HAL2 family 3'(2'),5'-bisphosphate nucleotidase